MIKNWFSGLYGTAVELLLHDDGNDYAARQNQTQNEKGHKAITISLY